MVTMKLPRSRRSPLSAAQKELAESYLPLARSLARPLKDSWPGEWDELDSAACLALVEAAGAYDPARNVTFPTFARHRIIGALRDVQRRLVVRGWRTDHERAPAVVSLHVASERYGTVLDCTPDPSAEAEMQAEEAFEGWLKQLPSKHAETCRQLYDRGLTQAEAAEALGCSQSRLSYMHREALAMLNGSWYSRPPINDSE